LTKIEINTPKLVLNLIWEKISFSPAVSGTVGPEGFVCLFGWLVGLVWFWFNFSWFSMISQTVNQVNSCVSTYKGNILQKPKGPAAWETCCLPYGTKIDGLSISPV